MSAETIEVRERRSALRLALDSLIARDILLPVPAAAVFVLDFRIPIHSEPKEVSK